MLTAAAKNYALDALLPADVSLHTAYSASGANEVTGGSPAYARKPISFSAASAGSKASSSTPTLDVPAATEVQFVGLWGLGSPSQFLGMFAVGGSEKEIIAIQLGSPEGVITIPSHGYSNNDKVVFYGGTPPTGLVEGTIYYVINATTDTFSVSATEGGAGIPLTGYPNGEVKVSKIVPETFGSQGTFQVSSATLALNA